MRNVVAVLVVLGIAALVWSKWPHSAGSPPSARDKAVSAATAPASTPTPPARPSGVRRLDPEERRRLGEQIAASFKRAREARAAAATGSSAGAAAIDDPMLTVEDLSQPVKDALQASIPLLAACYEKAGSAAPKTPLARMTMVSDPDLGTVIDSAAVTDAEGKPLEPALDECLRDAIDSLALPPLDKPGKLPLQYTFRFD